MPGKGVKSIVNVGAVGQPRDKDTRASYVLFDGETARYRRVVYNYLTAARKIIDAHLPPYFAERLAEGE